MVTRVVSPYSFRAPQFLALTMPRVLARPLFSHPGMRLWVHIHIIYFIFGKEKRREALYSYYICGKLSSRFAESPLSPSWRSRCVLRAALSSTFGFRFMWIVCS